MSRASQISISNHKIVFNDEWVSSGKPMFSDKISVEFNSRNGKDYRLCLDDNGNPFFREVTVDKL